MCHGFHYGFCIQELFPHAYIKSVVRFEVPGNTSPAIPVLLCFYRNHCGYGIYFITQVIAYLLFWAFLFLWGNLLLSSFFQYWVSFSQIYWQTVRWNSDTSQQGKSDVFFSFRLSNSITQTHTHTLAAAPSQAATPASEFGIGKLHHQIVSRTFQISTSHKLSACPEHFSTGESKEIW